MSLPEKYNDTIDLDKKKNYRQQALTEAHTKANDILRKGQPVCWRCYKNKFEELQKKKSEREALFDEREAKITLALDEYADEDTFFKGRQSAVNNRPAMIDGMKQFVPVFYQEWIHKPCGARIDTQVIIDKKEKPTKDKEK